MFSRINEKEPFLASALKAEWAFIIDLFLINDKNDALLTKNLPVNLSFNRLFIVNLILTYFLNSEIVFFIILMQSLNCSSFMTKGGAKRIIFP